ncbi:SH3 domain-containing protein [Thermoflexus sp.]|uniref:SH3 domain-containing protein n=1 Tax=Thermoflexus sp. TaxID=1969742 RepID=UPI0035E459A5
MKRTWIGLAAGLLLLAGLLIGLAQLRPAARQLPPPGTAQVILVTRSPVPGLTPEASSTPTSTPVGQRAVVTGTGGVGLRLREGPGLLYAVVTVLAEGSSVWVFPESVDADGLRWRRVRTEDGAIEGWVAESYLSLPEPEAP